MNSGTGVSVKNGVQAYHNSIPYRYYRCYSEPRYMNIQPDVGTRVSAGQYHVYSRDRDPLQQDYCTISLNAKR